jgi:phage terminase Nu1 subunit (DNA packaging protein)
MPGRLEVLGYIRRNESDSLQIPLTIGSGPSMRTIWFDAVQGPEATQVYEQQSREPVLLRGGFEDCSWSLWAYKGKLIRCDLPIHYIDDDSSVAEELTLRIKHLVLREEHRLQRIRREVQALENLERIPSAKRERISDDVRLFVWQRDEGKFMEATNLGAGEVRRAFRAAPQEQLARLSRLGIRIDGSLADLCQSLVAHSLNRDLMLYALASGLSQTLVNDSSEEMLRAIFESYDHSIDAYIDAFAHYSTMKKGLGGSAGRNDGFDLAHFLYLVPGTALITEDTRMRDLARAIGWPVESIPGVAGRI